MEHRHSYKPLSLKRAEEYKKMVMQVCALASGSSGNCFYVGNSKGAVLIDVGLSAKQICERMERCGLSPASVKGIFVTHEHIDHVRGVDVFARRFHVPIFATRKTAEAGKVCSDNALLRLIRSNAVVSIAGLSVEAFGKFHDAIDPVSYTLQEMKGKKRVTVLTDVGHACKRVQEQIADAAFLFLESNYDDQMLLEGGYPAYLKALIRSDIGHLSNRQAGLLALEHASAQLKHVVLSHISS